MFNRVGNLTVLSLSRRRNSIIESLHTFTHENRNWHERFNLRFPEEEQSDFTSVRIYWDYEGSARKKAAKEAEKDKDGDVAMSTAAAQQKSVDKGPPSDKGYYIFNQGKVLNVSKNDFSSIRKFLSKRLEEYQSPLMEAPAVQYKAKTGPSRMKIEQFWLK